MKQHTKVAQMFKVVALSAALFSIAPAHAAFTDWGVHDEIEFVTGHPGAPTSNNPLGTFLDVYAFTLPSFSEIVSVNVSNNSPSAKISGGDVFLFKGVFGDSTADTLIGNYSFNGVTGDTENLFKNLSSGSYFYEVAGSATGSKGGFYTLTSTLTPVPEPETYGMLMAGLGLMGFIARRRMKA